MVITPVFHRNKYWISSIELYDTLGRDKKKYYMWTVRHIFQNNSLLQPHDFFVYKKHIAGWKNPQRTDIYLSVPLAMAILIREGTNLSRNIRYCLEDTLKGLPTKTQSGIRS